MPPGAIPFPFGICRICKDKATGVHYGVATCEGCKGFFKRTITRGDNYKCFFGGNCDIVPKNRNRCKACRFRRCLETGMSVEAVRMGRIPKVEKEKALEVFNQTGSDYQKMEVVVQHSSTGSLDNKSNTAATDREECDPKDSEKDNEGTKMCTIHVTMKNDDLKKNKESMKGTTFDSHILETRAETSDQNQSQMMAQGTIAFEQGIQVSHSDFWTKAQIGLTVNQPDFQSVDLLAKSQNSMAVIRNETCKQDNVPPASHPPSNTTEPLLMSAMRQMGMDTPSKDFAYHHSSMKTNSVETDPKYGTTSVFSVPKLNYNTNATDSLHAENQCSDRFGMFQRSRTCPTMNTRPVSTCDESFGRFQASQIPAPNAFPGNHTVPEINIWGDNSHNSQTTTFSSFGSRQGHSDGQMYGQPGVLNYTNPNCTQSPVEGHSDNQFTVPSVQAQSDGVSQTPRQIPDIGMTSAELRSTPASVDLSIVRPCPSQTPSSSISSVSSKSSGRWRNYSPSLLKVLIEHVIESSDDSSMIENLKERFYRSKADQKAVTAVLGIINEVSKQRSSDKRSSPQIYLQQLPQCKTESMEKFLQDVKCFSSMSSPSRTSESDPDKRFLESSAAHTQSFLFSDSTNKQTDCQILDMSNHNCKQNQLQSRSVNSSKRDSESTWYTHSSFDGSSERSKSLGGKFKKTREHMNVVSSSTYVRTEDERQIQMTLDNMELAMKILYRLKPEHRHKLRLFKAGQRNLRVMTDSNADVKYVYEKIMESIPQLNERILGFCENVPGFTDLTKEDQQVLLKKAYYDIWMLTYAEYFFNGESNIILSTGELYSSAAMRRILNDQMVDTLISFAEKFNALNLSDLEISILCAVQLTSSDGLTVEVPEAVQKIHSHMLDVLDFEMKRNHGNNHSHLLISIFKLMPSLSVINRLQKEIIANFRVNRFDEEQGTTEP